MDDLDLPPGMEVGVQALMRQPAYTLTAAQLAQVAGAWFGVGIRAGREGFTAAQVATIADHFAAAVGELTLRAKDLDRPPGDMPLREL